MLKVNTALKELHLDNNTIKDKGGGALAAALEVNRTLQTLWLVKNPLGSSAVQRFSQVLQVNQSIRRLGMSSTTRIAPEVVAHMEAIRKSRIQFEALREVAPEAESRAASETEPQVPVEPPSSARAMDPIGEERVDDERAEDAQAEDEDAEDDEEFRRLQKLRPPTAEILAEIHFLDDQLLYLDVCPDSPTQTTPGARSGPARALGARPRAPAAAATLVPPSWE